MLRAGVKIMTTMTIIAGDGADDRRKLDRRKEKQAFDGEDRRVTARRSARERRASAR